MQNHTLPINLAAFAPPPLDPGGAVTSFTTNPDGWQNLTCTLSCGLLSRFGDAPNGLIRAVNTWQVDFALTKETRITERVSMEFGAQFFNIFNHVQFGDPSSSNLTLNYNLADAKTASGAVQTIQSLSAKNLGLIDTTVNFNSNNDNAASPNTGTGLPRQLQLMVRFTF